MISEEQYLEARKIVEQYHNENYIKQKSLKENFLQNHSQKEINDIIQEYFSNMDIIKFNNLLKKYHLYGHDIDPNFDELLKIYLNEKFEK